MSDLQRCREQRDSARGKLRCKAKSGRSVHHTGPIRFSHIILVQMMALSAVIASFSLASAEARRPDQAGVDLPTSSPPALCQPPAIEDKTAEDKVFTPDQAPLQLSHQSGVLSTMAEQRSTGRARLLPLSQTPLAAKRNSTSTQSNSPATALAASVLVHAWVSTFGGTSEDAPTALACHLESDTLIVAVHGRNATNFGLGSTLAANPAGASVEGYHAACNSCALQPCTAATRNPVPSPETEAWQRGAMDGIIMSMIFGVNAQTGVRKWAMTLQRAVPNGLVVVNNMLVACVSTAQHSVVTGPNGQTLYGDNYGRPGSFGGYQHALIAGWRLVDTTPVGPIWTNVIHVDGTTSCQGIIDRRSGEGAGASQPGASQPGTDHEDTTATTPAEHIEAPHVLVHVEIDPVMEGKCLECLHTHIGAGPLWPTACRATPVIVSVGLSDGALLSHAAFSAIDDIPRLDTMRFVPQLAMLVVAVLSDSPVIVSTALEAVVVPIVPAGLWLTTLRDTDGILTVEGIAGVAGHVTRVSALRVLSASTSASATISMVCALPPDASYTMLSSGHQLVAQRALLNRTAISTDRPYAVPPVRQLNVSTRVWVPPASAGATRNNSCNEGATSRPTEAPMIHIYASFDLQLARLLRSGGLQWSGVASVSDTQSDLPLGPGAAGVALLAISPVNASLGVDLGTGSMNSSGCHVSTASGISCEPIGERGPERAHKLQFPIAEQPEQVPGLDRLGAVAVVALDLHDMHVLWTAPLPSHRTGTVRVVSTSESRASSVPALYLASAFGHYEPLLGYPDVAQYHSAVEPEAWLGAPGQVCSGFHDASSTPYATLDVHSAPTNVMVARVGAVPTAVCPARCRSCALFPGAGGLEARCTSCEEGDMLFRSSPTTPFRTCESTCPAPNTQGVRALPGMSRPVPTCTGAELSASQLGQVWPTAFLAVAVAGLVLCLLSLVLDLQCCRRRSPVAKHRTGPWLWVVALSAQKTIFHWPSHLAQYLQMPDVAAQTVVRYDSSSRGITRTPAKVVPSPRQQQPPAAKHTPTMGLPIRFDSPQIDQTVVTPLREARPSPALEDQSPWSALSDLTASRHTRPVRHNPANVTNGSAAANLAEPAMRCPTLRVAIRERSPHAQDLEVLLLLGEIPDTQAKQGMTADINISRPSGVNQIDKRPHGAAASVMRSPTMPRATSPQTPTAKDGSYFSRAPPPEGSRLTTEHTAQFTPTMLVGRPPRSTSSHASGNTGGMVGLRPSNGPSPANSAASQPPLELAPYADGTSSSPTHTSSRRSLQFPVGLPKQLFSDASVAEMIRTRGSSSQRGGSSSSKPQSTDSMPVVAAMTGTSTVPRQFSLTPVADGGGGRADRRFTPDSPTRFNPGLRDMRSDAHSWNSPDSGLTPARQNSPSSIQESSMHSVYLYQPTPRDMVPVSIPCMTSKTTTTEETQDSGLNHAAAQTEFSQADPSVGSPHPSFAPSPARDELCVLDAPTRAVIYPTPQSAARSYRSAQYLADQGTALGGEVDQVTQWSNDVLEALRIGGLRQRAPQFHLQHRTGTGLLHHRPAPALKHSRASSILQRPPVDFGGTAVWVCGAGARVLCSCCCFSHPRRSGTINRKTVAKVHTQTSADRQVQVFKGGRRVLPGATGKVGATRLHSGTRAMGGGSNPSPLHQQSHAPAVCGTLPSCFGWLWVILSTTASVWEVWMGIWLLEQLQQTILAVDEDSESEVFNRVALGVFIVAMRLCLAFWACRWSGGRVVAGENSIICRRKRVALSGSSGGLLTTTRTESAAAAHRQVDEANTGASIHDKASLCMSTLIVALNPAVSLVVLPGLSVAEIRRQYQDQQSVLPTVVTGFADARNHVCGGRPGPIVRSELLSPPTTTHTSGDTHTTVTPEPLQPSISAHVVMMDSPEVVIMSPTQPPELSAVSIQAVLWVWARNGELLSLQSMLLCGMVLLWTSTTTFIVAAIVAPSMTATVVSIAGALLHGSLGLFIIVLMAAAGRHDGSLREMYLLSHVQRPAADDEKPESKSCASVQPAGASDDPVPAEPSPEFETYNDAARRNIWASSTGLVEFRHSMQSSAAGSAAWQHRSTSTMLTPNRSMRPGLSDVAILSTATSPAGMGRVRGQPGSSSEAASCGRLSMEARRVPAMGGAGAFQAGGRLRVPPLATNSQLSTPPYSKIPRSYASTGSTPLPLTGTPIPSPEGHRRQFWPANS